MEFLFFMLIGVAAWLIYSYNRLVSLLEVCRAAAANVETQLARRFDLYIKATSVLERGSEFERSVFKEVTALRSRTDLTMEQKVTELGRLIAVAEANPNVASMNLFSGMQDIVNDTESKIQKAREAYNFETGVYNITVRKFPMNIAAWILSFRVQRYFEHS